MQPQPRHLLNTLLFLLLVLFVSRIGAILLFSLWAPTNNSDAQEVARHRRGRDEATVTESSRATLSALPCKTHRRFHRPASPAIEHLPVRRLAPLPPRPLLAVSSGGAVAGGDVVAAGEGGGAVGVLVVPVARIVHIRPRLPGQNTRGSSERFRRSQLALRAQPFRTRRRCVGVFKTHADRETRTAQGRTTKKEMLACADRMVMKGTSSPCLASSPSASPNARRNAPISSTCTARAHRC